MWNLGIILALCGLMVGNAQAGDDDIRLKPYVLALKSNGDFNEIVASTKEKLANAGFEIVGEYTPYETAVIIVVTNAELKALAAASEKGGFGAGIRVAITHVGEEVQVSYLNMGYIFHLYRMDGEIENVVQQMESALGMEMVFGSKEGLEIKKLRDYRYMFAMPYFTDLDELEKFDSYETALEAVEKGLVDNSAEVTKVYRIDLPGKKETVFGVGIKAGDGGDAHVMNVVDKEDIRSTAHLPYELLVSGNKVYALKGRFRIAASFPDLSMGTFMKIRSAPGSIKDALKAIVEKK
ncbi:MAG: hypothetical protein H6696_02225 [Deferribacteres bacterium]|nr:hypothetical protein [candidate division KSB1 bacterium]MCB9500730.1 hypothetical protein [Deferribacteres bacterium]